MTEQLVILALMSRITEKWETWAKYNKMMPRYNIINSRVRRHKTKESFSRWHSFVHEHDENIKQPHTKSLINYTNLTAY
jgi:hypothetical protein